MAHLPIVMSHQKSNMHKKVLVQCQGFSSWRARCVSRSGILWFRCCNVCGKVSHCQMICGASFRRASRRILPLGLQILALTKRTSEVAIACPFVGLPWLECFGNKAGVPLVMLQRADECQAMEKQPPFVSWTRTRRALCMASYRAMLVWRFIFSPLSWMQKEPVAGYPCHDHGFWVSRRRSSSLSRDDCRWNIFFLVFGLLVCVLP